MALVRKQRSSPLAKYYNNYKDENKGRRTWSPHKSDVSGLQGPKEQEFAMC